MAELHSNRSKHDRNFEKAVEKALRLVGGQAERFAKETISDMGAVDTGFLRNSITWALDGGTANSPVYYDDAMQKIGEYEGEAPSEGGGNRSVYIGTNVYYAPYVEYGTSKMEARPFLSSSIQGHKNEYEDLFKEAFSYYF